MMHDASENLTNAHFSHIQKCGKTLRFFHCSGSFCYDLTRQSTWHFLGVVIGVNNITEPVMAPNQRHDTKVYMEICRDSVYTYAILCAAEKHEHVQVFQNFVLLSNSYTSLVPTTYFLCTQDPNDHDLALSGTLGKRCLWRHLWLCKLAILCKVYLVSFTKSSPCFLYPLQA